MLTMQALEDKSQEAFEELEDVGSNIKVVSRKVRATDACTAGSCGAVPSLASLHLGRQMRPTC